MSHFLAEEFGGAEEAGGEQHHGEDAEGAGDRRGGGGDAAHEHVDRFRHGIEDCFLGEDHAVADIEHGKGEGQDGAGNEVGAEEREADLEQGFPGRSAHVGRGFLEGDVGLLESGIGRADDVGEAVDGVGNDQHEGGILARIEQTQPQVVGFGPAFGEHRPAEGDKIGEGQDEAGQGEGDHRHHIEEVFSAELFPRQHVGHTEPENQVERGGRNRIDQGIFDAQRGQVGAEDFPVISGGPFGGEDGEEPLGRERLDDDAEVGEEGDADEQRDRAGHEPAQGAREAGHIVVARTPAQHGVIALAEFFAEEEERGDEEEGEYDEGVTERVVGLGDEVEDLGRDGGLEFEHQGDAEVGEGRDEHDGGAGEDPREGQGEGDGPEDAAAARAEVAGGVTEAGVEIGQGRLHAEVHDRVEVQDLEEDDPGEAAVAEPVRRVLQVGQAQLAEDEVEAAEAGEELFQADGAHERGEDEGQEHGPAEEGFAREIAAEKEIGQGDGDEEAKESGPAGDQEAVEKTFPVEGVFKNDAEVIEGESADPVLFDDERALQEVADGVDQEQPEEEDQEGKEDFLHGGRILNRRQQS